LSLICREGIYCRYIRIRHEARIAGVLEVTLHSGAEDGVYSYSNKENCEEVVTYTLVDDATAKIAGILALDSWRGLGCLDAGRVDIRCDSAGNPNFYRS